MSAPVGAVRAAVVEPDRLVQPKREVQIGPGQLNHEPRAQRIYTEELRREPILDKYVCRVQPLYISDPVSSSALSSEVGCEVYIYISIYLSPLRSRRSVGVEKVPAGGRVSSLNQDHLKPMRKRKRKEYLSPSEEDSDMEGMVGCQVYVTAILHPHTKLR